MVACGGVLAGWLTGLDWFDWFDGFDWLDWLEGVDVLAWGRVRWEVVESPLPPEPDAWDPVVPAVPWPAWVLPVWVVRPRPTAAPIALTTLSPARPAWRRRLRLRGFMSFTVAAPSVRTLCRPWVARVGSLTGT